VSHRSHPARDLIYPRLVVVVVVVVGCEANLIQSKQQFRCLMGISELGGRLHLHSDVVSKGRVGRRSYHSSTF
jgi:hypothetical protein